MELRSAHAGLEAVVVWCDGGVGDNPEGVDATSLFSGYPQLGFTLVLTDASSQALGGRAEAARGGLMIPALIVPRPFLFSNQLISRTRVIVVNWLRLPSRRKTGERIGRYFNLGALAARAALSEHMQRFIIGRCALSGFPQRRQVARSESGATRWFEISKLGNVQTSLPVSCPRQGETPFLFTHLRVCLFCDCFFDSGRPTSCHPRAGPGRCSPFFLISSSSRRRTTRASLGGRMMCRLGRRGVPTGQICTLGSDPRFPRPF